MTPHTTTNPTLDKMLQEDAREQSVAPDKLAVITTTAHELRAVRARIAKGEELLKELQKKAAELEQQVLPALMDEAGVKELTLDEGTTLVRGEAIYASLSQENMPRACAWLVKNGYGGLVKNLFDIELPRGSTAEALRIQALLKKGHVKFDFNQQVHGQTLRAFVRESVEAGRKLPKEIKVHVQPIVEIKEAKQKKR